MMKKIYLLACPALIALSSCTSEVNDDNFIDKTNSISFAAYPTKSRAVDADITSDNMKGDNFGVAGYSNNSLYLNKGTNGVEQKWDATSSTWEYANMADLKYWPENNMDFYAYFPYSDNATFAATNNDAENSTVMTIPNVDCSHDVLFAFAGNQSKKTRVPLTFHHAFSKIKTLQIEMPAEGIVYKSGCQVEVQKVEFINTSKSGSVQVNKDGKATYEVATPNVILDKTISTPVTVNSTNTSTNLIDNGETSNGYFFSTSSAEVNSVTGTSKTMWDGKKASITGEGAKLSTSGFVYLKLTCKVWNGADTNKQYYVGGASTYGEVYIPLKGTETGSISSFDAGKRYIYKIVMKDNVGFTDAGDPILTPILFNVNSVEDWGDVTVTITL